jgi:BlaR1 peptidase M56
MNYLLESTVCITIFYGLYYLIFRRLTFIRLNRIYLLSSLVVGLSLPLISYQIKEVVKIPARIESEEMSSISLVTNSSTPSVSNTPIEETFNWNMILQGIYVLGILFMLIKLLIIIYKLLKINRISSGNDFISTKSKYANSSFFNLIFIDDSNLSENEINQILEHEKWHIRLFHSYDLIFVEILKIVFWFNPILWLYQRSLSEVHEYEVDTRMIQTYNPQMYAHLLLKLANPTIQSTTHQFSRKPLTDRIHFLFTKQKSVPMKRLAYLSVLPILGAFFMAFSVEKVIDYQEVEESSKYFKIYKKTDALVNNEVLVKENKVVSNLIYGKNRVALTMNPTKISMDAIVSASKYFKKIGFNLDVISFAYYDSSKQLDKFEVSLTEDIENKKKYRGKKIDEKSDLPAKFTFDLKKMKSEKLDDIITILADRSTGEYFVAPLSPPPPPPAPPKALVSPKTPPTPPVPPKLGLFKNISSDSIRLVGHGELGKKPLVIINGKSIHIMF